MLRVRNKGTVERIDIPPDKLEEAKKILNSDHVADAVKRELMRKLANGRCCVCDNIAIHKVIFDISDEKQAAKKVERYCEACLKTVYENDEIKTPEDYGVEIGDVHSL